MSIAGLWHGASLNFIIWGILNGLILCFEKMFNLHNGRGIFRVFINILIIFNLWIVFRITEMSKFFEYTSKLYSSFFDAFNINNYLIIIFVIIMILSQKIDNFHSIKNFSKKINITFIIIFFIFIISTGLGINLGQSEKFIYFQF
jgi:alginate O-acetyltransferase complex protein AlgI